MSRGAQVVFVWVCLRLDESLEKASAGVEPGASGKEADKEGKPVSKIRHKVS